MKDELVAILASHDTAGNGDYPLSYRFHKIGNRWYLQVIFEQSFAGYRTTSKYGTIGLDYNDGFIELSETDESGNLMHQKHYNLKYHGTGSRAEVEIRDVIADIVGYAKSRCKDIIIEDLDFKRTKAKQTASSKQKGKRYNRVNVVMVNPKNTSKIGKQKYYNSKKLNVHQAASYVIARRGQGYIDKLAA